MVDVFYGSENDGPYLASFDREEDAARFRIEHRDTILVDGKPAVIGEDGSVVTEPEAEPTPEQETEQAAPGSPVIEDGQADDGADGPGQPRHAAEPEGVATGSQDATTENLATDNSTSRQTGQ